MQAGGGGGAAVQWMDAATTAGAWWSMEQHQFNGITARCWWWRRWSGNWRW